MGVVETVVDALLNLEVNGVNVDSLIGVALIGAVVVFGYAYASKKFAKPLEGK